MRGIQDSEFVNSRVEGRCVRVSDILFTLLHDNPNEQLNYWNLEQYKVFAAIQHYWVNKEEFADWLEEERDEYDAPTTDEIDDAIRAWSGFGDTVVEFEDAAGVGRSECPDCGGSLEDDWDDYSLVC
jgi:hypothetical protein